MKHRPRYGERWAALSAIALLAFLLLVDWFGAPAVEGGAASGWESLGWLALVLCLLAVVAGLATAVAFSLYDSPVLPILAAIAATVIGILAVVALLVQVIFQPGEDGGVQVLAGWWLGLLAAAGIARGGFLSMRDEYLPDVPIADVPVRPAPVG